MTRLNNIKKYKREVYISLSLHGVAERFVRKRKRGKVRGLMSIAIYGRHLGDNRTSTYNKSDFAFRDRTLNKMTHTFTTNYVPDDSRYNVE